MAEFLPLATTIAGGAAGLLGGSGGAAKPTYTNQSTQTNSQGNTNTSTTPWEQILPYLIGGGTGGPQGIYPEAASLYGNYSWNPSATGSPLQQAQYTLGNAPMNSMYTGMSSLANQAGGQPLGQQFNLAQMLGQGPSAFGINLGGGVAPVDMTAARGAQGSLDPTAALQGFLNGTAGNQYVDANAKALTDLITRGTADAMHTAGDDAGAAGQYGGSRQALAQATIAERLPTTLAPALTDMYSQARENALNRQMTVGTGLNQQAESVATNNANRAVQQQQFGAQMPINYANASSNIFGNAVGNAGGLLNLSNNAISSLSNVANLPYDYQNNLLKNYASMVLPYQTNFQSGNSNTQQSSTSDTQGTGLTPPTYSNPAAGITGGALAGLGIGKGLGNFGFGSTPGAGAAGGVAANATPGAAPGFQTLDQLLAALQIA